MRPIDADALKQFEITMPRGDGYSDFVFAGHIHQAPTIDAVPVVRCKDCKYSDECHKSVQYTRRESPTSMTLGSVPVEYCSRGERKEDV